MLVREGGVYLRKQITMREIKKVGQRRKKTYVNVKLLAEPDSIIPETVPAFAPVSTGKRRVEVSVVTAEEAVFGVIVQVTAAVPASTVRAAPPMQVTVLCAAVAITAPKT
jgi:hypothetical protein